MKNTHDTPAAAAPQPMIPVELPVLQRLQIIEQLIPQLVAGLQNAASRDGVGLAVKSIEDKIEAVAAQLKTLQQGQIFTSEIDRLQSTLGRMLRIQHRQSLGLVCAGIGGMFFGVVLLMLALSGRLL